MTERIEEVRDKAAKTREMLDNDKVFLDYGTYCKYRGKILTAE